MWILLLLQIFVSLLCILSKITIYSIFSLLLYIKYGSIWNNIPRTAVNCSIQDVYCLLWNHYTSKWYMFSFANNSRSPLISLQSICVCYPTCTWRISLKINLFFRQLFTLNKHITWSFATIYDFIMGKFVSI